MFSRRIFVFLLPLVLILVVGAAISYASWNEIAAHPVITLRGIVGSEKEDFFQDARVIDLLRRNGLTVEFDKAGSRQIATSFDLSEYDFAFPAGLPAAEKIRREIGASSSYDAFFTPMAIATWKPIAEILVANQIAVKEQGYYILDMTRYLDLVAAGKRWSDLQDNDTYDVNKSVLVTTTDVRHSNSAAMYLAVASFVANGHSVVQNDSEINKVMPLMLSLFFDQGFTAYSSEVPFNDYLTMGMGKAPMVMIYEAQFLHHASLPDSDITDEMVLMVPSPNIFTKHILVPLTPEGEALIDLFENNKEMRRLVVEHGFRNGDSELFSDFTKRINVAMPHNQVEFVEPPAYEVLEQLLNQIDLYYYRTFFLGK